MIRFAAKPDRLFCELLNCAITVIVEHYLSFDDPRDQADWFCACLPRSARYFTPSEAKEQLLRLQQLLHQDGLYEVTKYHWLLLYECLETFCEGFNDQPHGWLALNYRIQRIHFSSLARLFFWDTTFLLDHLAKMSLPDNRTMLIWPESVGLSAGFKTHADELAIALCDEAVATAFEAQPEAPALPAGSRSYPSI
jgi:hypothetical protein